MTTDPQSAGAEAALAAARAHEAAGERRAALAEYARSMQLQPDAEIAHHMVGLRHDAMQAEPSKPGRDTWPPPLPDPFPGSDSPPEVGVAALTPEVLGGALLHHGALIVRGVQTQAQAISMRELVIASLDSRDRTAAKAPRPGDERGYRPAESTRKDTDFERGLIRSIGGMLLGDSPLLLWAVLDLLSRTGVLDVMGHHFAEPVVLSYNKSVLRRVSAASHAWHQDGSFMGADVRAVNVWLALSECGAGTSAPGLDLVPARVPTILDTQTEGAMYPNTIGQRLIDRTSSTCPPVAPRFAAGDALMFDERLVHRSGSGDGFTAERIAIESWFFAPSHFPEGYVPLLA